MKEAIVKSLKKVLSLNEKEIEKMLEAPPSQDLGDFAFPCFTLAKEFKKNPIQIAQELLTKISSKDFEKVEAKGPYINFFLNKDNLAKETLSEISKKKDKYGADKISKENVMVEFSQPNTHKAFHVGHIRGTSLGESISRILEFTGDKVIRANYSGDTGMHIAKWLWCYKKFHSKEKLREEESWIASIYVEAVQRLDKESDFQDEVDKINQALEEGKDKELNTLWKKTREASIKAWKKIYDELNTKFDVHYFESEMQRSAKEFSQNLLKMKIAKISDGATIVDFKEFNHPELGVFLLLRKDGTVLYGGKDMSLAERKFTEYKLDKAYYVIGREQDLYIHQVFKTLELAKTKAAGKTSYVPLSEVRLPTGKMSSRTGDNVLYSEFTDELKVLAKEELNKRQKLSERELGERATAIAIAAIKYSMLKQDTNKSIIFDKKEALNFEGNTGPYLLYTYARAKSILRKAKYKKFPYKVPNLNASEKKLILNLQKFPETVEKARQDLAPNHIANYVYSLAQAFNEFYHENKVIGTNEEKFRLELVSVTSQVIKNALTLLGISVLEEM